MPPALSDTMAPGPPGASAWPNLIEQIGGDGFWPALLALCHGLTGATDLSLMTCAAAPAAAGSGPCSAPRLVAAASQQGDAAQRAGQRYLDGQHYRLDDNLRGLPALGGGLGLRQIQAADLPSSTWRADCYDTPGLEGRLSLLAPGDGGWIVLNTYRPRRCTVAADTAFDHLRSQAPMLAAALRRHLALMARLALVARPAAATDPLATLSLREREVVQAILAGHSAKACARQLGLSPTSVATYRQRAFQKLGVRRQIELARLVGGGRADLPTSHTLATTAQR
jgi:DNA-binding CsgD family transcriptional regulator